MSERYLVRTGLFDSINWLESAPGFCGAAHMEVICRTSRGLEAGVILASSAEIFAEETAGQILRPVSEQDRLVLDRLERFKLRAIESCEQLLRERGISASLVDAEHLFDGKHLYFHFWGPAPPELDAVLDELAAMYDHRVGFSRFAARLAAGCGPGCGTTSGSCGSEQAGGCSGCSSGGCGLKSAAQRAAGRV